MAQFAVSFFDFNQGIDRQAEIGDFIVVPNLVIADPGNLNGQISWDLSNLTATRKIHAPDFDIHLSQHHTASLMVLHSSMC